MRACGARERETAAPAAQLPLPRVPSSLPSYPELLSVLLTLKRGPCVPLGGAWSCLRASRPPWCQLTSSRPISWQPAPAAGAGNVPLQNWMCGSRGAGLRAAPSPLASGLWSTLCGTPKASSGLVAPSQPAPLCISQLRGSMRANGRSPVLHPCLPWPAGLISSPLPSLGRERASVPVCQCLPKPKPSPSRHSPVLQAPRSCFLELKRNLSLPGLTVLTASSLLTLSCLLPSAVSPAGFGTPRRSGRGAELKFQGSPGGSWASTASDGLPK